MSRTQKTGYKNDGLEEGQTSAIAAEEVCDQSRAATSILLVM